MTLHVNMWLSRSRKLAGRLAPRSLPASATVRNIAVDALNGKMCSDETQDSRDKRTTGCHMSRETH